MNSCFHFAISADDDSKCLPPNCDPEFCAHFSHFPSDRNPPNETRARHFRPKIVERNLCFEKKSSATSLRKKISIKNSLNHKTKCFETDSWGQTGHLGLKIK